METEMPTTSTTTTRTGIVCSPHRVWKRCRLFWGNTGTNAYDSLWRYCVSVYNVFFMHDKWSLVTAALQINGVHNVFADAEKLIIPSECSKFQQFLRTQVFSLGACFILWHFVVFLWTGVNRGEDHILHFGNNNLKSK